MITSKKKCNQCGLSWSRKALYYAAVPANRDGLNNKCKKCQKLNRKLK